MSDEVSRLSRTLAALGRATTPTEIDPAERWKATKIVLDHLLEQYDAAKVAAQQTPGA